MYFNMAKNHGKNAKYYVMMQEAIPNSEWKEIAKTEYVGNANLIAKQFDEMYIKALGNLYGTIEIHSTNNSNSKYW